ncbi:hypothetical protein ACFQV2_30880 [Actinokineospora soli]|uniref:Uncharacterized protein n=1 Tax=Actinokineospora soli TaxID=1048753 RepID=A0ABW2TUN1_9PSEU
MTQPPPGWQPGPAQPPAPGSQPVPGQQAGPGWQSPPGQSFPGQPQAAPGWPPAPGWQGPPGLGHPPVRPKKKGVVGWVVGGLLGAAAIAGVVVWLLFFFSFPDQVARDFVAAVNSGDMAAAAELGCNGTSTVAQSTPTGLTWSYNSKRGDAYLAQLHRGAATQPEAELLVIKQGLTYCVEAVTLLPQLGES